ncbi:putative transposase [Trichonephila clavipes]|nr:putative transposase [Trichonephila clavipes]
MAFALQNSTIEEQRSVIRFLTAEGEKLAAIHRWMVTVYGEKCVSDKSVRKWSARFRAGRESVGDDQRPGQVNTVITSDLIDKVDDLVRSDQRVTLRMLALKVDVSYGTVWTIVHDRLRFRKVRYLWNSSSTEKALTLCTVRHSDAYKNKRPGLLTEGVVPLHDDVRPHVTRVTQMKMDKFKWETLDHPPYSPDMSACDFHVFDILKKHLKGKRFNWDYVFNDTVKDWVSTQPQEF